MTAPRVKCAKGCLCLCHEGLGDVEHLGRPCYGKPGSEDRSDFGTLAHIAYWNPVLQADYCHACGDHWPCLPWRQANPRCKCSHGRSLHTRGEHQCWVSVCGCASYRPKENS